MERTKWTDDLLDHKFATMDKQFERLHEDLARMRVEMHQDLAAIRVEMVAMHRQLVYLIASLWIGVLGLFGTLVTQL
jgi:hypothetical protein